MNNLLNAENTGTPLIIIEKAAYKNWLASQEKQSQAWLSNTQFTGKGLALIPNSQGEINQAVFVVTDASDFFACGDLIKQLPQGQYLLKADAKHVEAISFGWLVGAYQYDRYISNKSAKVLASLAINNADTVASAIKFAQATALTRDLVNTPAADMMPEDIGSGCID